MKTDQTRYAGAQSAVSPVNAVGSKEGCGLLLWRAAGAFVFLLLSSCAGCPMCGHERGHCCQKTTTQAVVKKEGLRAQAQAPYHGDSIRLQEDVRRDARRSYR